MNPIAQSALHDWSLRRGARMEQRGVWQEPGSYGDVAAEVEAARQTLAVGEIVGRTTLEVVGRDLTPVAQSLSAGAAAPGHAMEVMVEGAGAARWYRLTRDSARLVLASYESAAAVQSVTAGAGCLHATDVSSGLTTLAVLGPRAPDLLARLVRVDMDPRGFADRCLTQTGAAGIPLLIVRWDHGALLSYELTVGRDVAEYFLDELLHAGHDLDPRMIGIEALEAVQE